MGMYLKGTGGGVWFHDFETPAQLPEYAQVQLRAGDLTLVPEPPDAHVHNMAIRPRDTDPKGRWSAYIRSMGQPVSGSDEASMSRAEMIEWANEIEAEQNAEKGSKK